MLYDPVQLQRTAEAARNQVSNLPEAEQPQRIQEILEASWARIEACAAAFKGPEVVDTGGRFDTLSLIAWLSVANAAGVPYVPCSYAGVLDKVGLMTGDLDTRLELDDLEAPGIIRPDHAAGARIKIDKGLAGQTAPAGTVGAVRGADGAVHLELDDRLIRNAPTYVGEPHVPVIPVWFRPWIEAATVEVKRRRFLGGGVDTWPLEWRVFVEQGRVAGISAYYVQAPIRHVDSVVRASARQAVAYSDQLIAHMRAQRIQPWHPRYLDRLEADALAFTLDFIALPDGSAVLLEAGPTCHDARTPEWGAHPCFFEGRGIDGWALGPNNIHAIPTPTT